MRHHGLSVAVIGGGIGGLSAGLSLLEAGLDVHVYEQAPRISEVRAGVAVSPNATRILYRLRLGHELARTGVRPHRLVGNDAANGVIEEAMKEQQTMIETNVGSLAVRERGEGRPAVLWHSLFMDERSWERVEEDPFSGAPARAHYRSGTRSECRSVASATRWRSARPLPRRCSTFSGSANPWTGSGTHGAATSA